MAKPGKPRKEGASGRHDYERGESRAFWRPRRRAEFEALPPAKQAEQRAHIRRLLAVSPSAELRALAEDYGIGDDDEVPTC